MLDLDTGDGILPDLHVSCVGATIGKDQEYLKLIEAIRQGFPEAKSALDVDLHRYWDIALTLPP